MRQPALSLVCVLLVLPVALPVRVFAQGAQRLEEDEEEDAGRSRGGYAWGETPPEGSAEGETTPAFHRFHHIFTSLGIGGTVRVVAHAAVCNPDTPGLEGCRFSPPYLQLRGVFFFEGDGDLQHGVTLGVATNLSADGLRAEGIDPLSQWTLSPGYALRYWTGPWFQLVGTVGIPIAFAGVSGTMVRNATAFNWGIELQVAAILKFLTGLGVYVAVNGTAWFAGTGSVWPTLSLEGGAVFEYEVLP